MNRISKIFIVVVLFFYASVSTDVYADKNPKQQEFTDITIIQKNGKVNDDGTITYAGTRRKVDSKKKSIIIHCFDPGNNRCPAEVTVLITVVTGVSSNDASIDAINVVKDRISKGEIKGKVLYSGVLYSWDNGVLYDNGVYEMDLRSTEFENILP